MTEPSSAGNPDGGTLPPDHPLGPAAPIPPREKEAERSGQGSGHDGGGASQDVASGVGHEGAGPESNDGESGAGDDGRPGADRREEVLDPSAGATGHHAASIRDEQGTHSAGTVPAAYNGEGSPEDPEDDRHPEDAAAEPDTWDSGGAAD